MAYSISVEFEWYESTNESNQLKHGVSFEEASQLFCQDVETLEIFDELHSDLEDRSISIGPISGTSFSSSGLSVTLTSSASSAHAGQRLVSRSGITPTSRTSHGHR